MYIISKLKCQGSLRQPPGRLKLAVCHASAFFLLNFIAQGPSIGLLWLEKIL